jgi:hypothetical protein
MVAKTPSLQILLSALEEPGSCFVLGAGVSAPIVPLAAQLGAHVRKRLLAIGSFPANPIPRDVVSNQILGPFQKSFARNADASTIEDELVVGHLSPAAVRAAAVVVLRPEPPLYAPPQYHVFGLSKYRLALVNFNNDGLANQYCSQHAIINVHGTSLSAEDRALVEWERHIDVLQNVSELRGVEIPGLLFPQPEPKEIAITPEYRVAEGFLQAARRLILVGYSFGDMDDGVAYDLVTSTIRSRRIPTVVAKPDAVDLALRISEDSRSSTVVGLSVYWDKLASAIIASIGRPRHKTCYHGRLCSKCVGYLYNAFLDGVVL